MARIRTIKPDFFLHETVAGLPAMHRLLFVGLWTLADKRGLLEDRPRRIKAALFPWDECDVDGMLWDLAAARLILRYDARKADGEPVEAISVLGFAKHQRPHPKESEVDLSAPGKETASRENKRQAKPDPQPIPSSPAGKGRSLGKESLDVGKEILDSPAAPDPGVVVFEHWRKVMGKNSRTEFDRKRKTAVEARLKGGYSAEDLMRAIDGCAKTPHNLGQNDRGERYDDLELICRDAAHVDRFMGNAKAPPRPTATRGRASFADTNWDEPPPSDEPEILEAM